MDSEFTTPPTLPIRLATWGSLHAAKGERQDGDADGDDSVSSETTLDDDELEQALAKALRRGINA